MGKALKLIQKLKRRDKQMRTDRNGFDRYDKQSQLEEKMAKSKGAFSLVRKIQRRLDRAFGINMIADEPKVSKRENMSVIERYDFGTGDYGTRVTMAAGLIADMGVQPNDVVKILSGTLKGTFLRVVTVVDSTHLRLEDASALNKAATKEKTSITAIADVAGSLGGKYFTISSPTVDYYVWFNTGSSVDPAPMGLTGIEVAITANSTAAQVAAALASVLDLHAAFSCLLSGTSMTVTNDVGGTATDAADVDSGMTISVLVQGAAANPTVSESNKLARFQISDVKKSYV